MKLNKKLRLKLLKILISRSKRKLNRWRRKQKVMKLLKKNQRKKISKKNKMKLNQKKTMHSLNQPNSQLFTKTTSLTQKVWKQIQRN